METARKTFCRWDDDKYRVQVSEISPNSHFCSYDITRSTIHGRNDDSIDGNDNVDDNDDDIGNDNGNDSGNDNGHRGSSGIGVIDGIINSYGDDAGDDAEKKKHQNGRDSENGRGTNIRYEYACAPIVTKEGAQVTPVMLGFTEATIPAPPHRRQKKKQLQTSHPKPLIETQAQTQACESSDDSRNNVAYDIRASCGRDDGNDNNSSNNRNDNTKADTSKKRESHSSLTNNNNKKQKTNASPLPSSSSSSSPESCILLSYIFQLPTTLGKFDVKKAKKLGIPPGPVYAKLKVSGQPLGA